MSKINLSIRDELKIEVGKKFNNYAVIGGAGFIGSHIVDELIAQGHNVFVIDNFVSGNRKNVHPKAKIIRHDIVKKHRGLYHIFLRYKIDYVFHLAAEPYIPECYERPEDFFNVNANGTMNVLMACKAAKIKKIVYFSTSEVYGTVEGKISETTPLNPQSTYAVSKLAGDRLAFTLFHEQKIPVVIVRQFNCYGERETHEYVIPEIISQVDSGDTPGILMLGNIKAKRDFMYVKDAANISVQLMKLGKVGEVYNVGTGVSISIEEIAKTIISRQDKKIKIEIDQKRLRPFDVEKLEANTTKLKKIITPKLTPFKEGLDNTIKWYLQNGHKWGFE